MAKIQLYFKDLNKEKQDEIRKQLKEELKGNIEEAKKDKKTENEVIDTYIMEHNFANEFKV